MQGILFPHSNILFDIQTQDPAVAQQDAAGGAASSTYGAMYGGWQRVENSTIALIEAARYLITVPGRLCQNGRPAPVARPDWLKYARLLETTGNELYKLAKAKDRDALSEATNQLAEACENCHSVYRDVRGGDANRCR
jgi:hypothetical protein